MNKCKISENSTRKHANDGGILFGWFLLHVDKRIRNARYCEPGHTLPFMSPKTILFLLIKITLRNPDAEPLKYSSVLQKKIKKDKASLSALRKPGWIILSKFFLPLDYLNIHTYMFKPHGVVWLLHTVIHHSPCSSAKRVDNADCFFSSFVSLNRKNFYLSSLKVAL